MKTSCALIKTSCALIKTSCALMKTSCALIKTSCALMKTSCALMKTSCACMKSSSACMKSSYRRWKLPCAVIKTSCAHSKCVGAARMVVRSHHTRPSPLAIACWITLNIATDARQLLIIAHDMLIIVTLPKASLKRRPSFCHHSRDVAASCDRFESTDDLPQRAPWLPQSIPNQNNTVHVIGHNHPGVEPNSQEAFWKRLPLVSNHLSSATQSNNAILTHTKQIRSPLESERYKISTITTIVVATQTN